MLSDLIFSKKLQNGYFSSYNSLQYQIQEDVNIV